MHIEFSKTLQLLVSDSAALKPYGLDSSEAICRLAEGRRAIEVEDAPPDLDAWIASPLCFELARIVRREASVSIEPIALATELLAAAPMDKYFDLSVGGKGFLNATPNPQFVVSFLNGLQSASASCLCGESFVVASDAIVQKPLEEQILHSNVADLVKELRTSRRDEQTLNFLAECESSSSLSWDVHLQLLAMLRDKELDPNAFHEGLFGSHNVSWYLQYFQKCMKSLEAETWFSDEICITADQLPSSLFAPPNPQDTVDLASARIIRVLLSFRVRYQRAMRSGEPALLLATTRELILSFFSLFNLPQVRASIHPESSERSPILELLMKDTWACALPALSTLETLSLD